MANLDSQTIKQIECQLETIETSHNYCVGILNKIREEFNSCLLDKHKDFANVIHYYEDPRFFNTAESRKIFILIQISLNELSTYGKPLFLDRIHDSNEAIEKYVLVTLAIRRINLQISNELVEQAKQYILSLQLSPLAIIEIIKNELFEGIDWLLNKLYILLSTQWNSYEQACFCSYNAELFPTELNCIRVASIYLESNKPILALTYLEKISNPSNEITDLISKLKGANSEQS